MDDLLARGLASALGLEPRAEHAGAVRLVGVRGAHRVEVFLAGVGPHGSEVVVDALGRIPRSLRVVRGDGRRAVRGTLDEVIDRHLWVSGEVDDLASVFGPKTRRALLAWLVTPPFELFGGVVRCSFEWPFGQSDDDLPRIVARVETLASIAEALALPAEDLEARLVENALTDPLRPARHRSAEVLAERTARSAHGDDDRALGFSAPSRAIAEHGARWARRILALGSGDEDVLGDALDYLRTSFPESLPDRDWLVEAAPIAGPRFAVALGRALGRASGASTDAGLAELLERTSRVDVQRAIIDALEHEGTAHALPALEAEARRFLGDRGVKDAARRAILAIEARLPTDHRGQLSLAHGEGAVSFPDRNTGELALHPGSRTDDR